jgi:hypothetical protein
MQVPVGKQTRTLQVRSLGFEIQTTRDGLFSMLPDLEPAGLFVAQLTKRVPDTLRSEWLFESSPARVQRCNSAGVLLTFDLPHANEVAVVWSPDRQVVEAVIARLGAA